jgi:hypothetical protein
MIDISKYKTSFVCPKCYSEEWGTSFPKNFDLEAAIGHCGQCNFSWPRKNDISVMRITKNVVIMFGPYGELYAVPITMKELFKEKWTNEHKDVFRPFKVVVGHTNLIFNHCE